MLDCHLFINDVNNCFAEINHGSQILKTVFYATQSVTNTDIAHV